jgi:hypothetical protein
MRRLLQIKKLPQYRREDGESYKVTLNVQRHCIEDLEGGFVFSLEREKEEEYSGICLINPPSEKGVKEIYNPIGWNDSSPIGRTIDSNHSLTVKTNMLCL